MPRKRVNLGLKQRYGHDALLRAIADVKTKKYTMRKASEIYKVPLSTLCDNVNGKSQSNKIGAKPKLSAETEAILADYFANLIQNGFNPTYNHVSRIIADFLIEHNMSHLFKNGCPGRDWFYEFKKRWRHKFGDPEPLIERPDRKSNLRKNKNMIGTFLTTLAKQYSSFDYLAKPENVWAVDEISLTLDCNLASESNILLKQKNSDQNNQDPSSKQRFTLISCANAAGETLPPFVIYKSKLPKYDKLVENNRLPNSIFCSSSTGWMEADQLVDWFRDPFLDRVSNINGPKILLVNSDAAELCVDLFEMASRCDVNVVCVPSSDSVRISNPIEAGVHRHVRNIWKKIIEKYVLKTQASQINRNHLPYLISKLYEKAFSKTYCSNGFTKSGLYPLNYEKFGDNQEIEKNPAQTSALCLIKSQVIEEIPSEQIETEIISVVDDESEPTKPKLVDEPVQKEPTISENKTTEEMSSIEPENLSEPKQNSSLELRTNNILGADIIRFQSDILNRIERLNAEARSIQMSIFQLLDPSRLLASMMPVLPPPAPVQPTFSNAVFFPQFSQVQDMNQANKRPLEISQEEIIVNKRIKFG